MKRPNHQKTIVNHQKTIINHQKIVKSIISHHQKTTAPLGHWPIRPSPRHRHQCLGSTLCWARWSNSIAGSRSSWRLRMINWWLDDARWLSMMASVGQWMVLESHSWNFIWVHAGKDGSRCLMVLNRSQMMAIVTANLTECPSSWVNKFTASVGAPLLPYTQGYFTPLSARSHQATLMKNTGYWHVLIMIEHQFFKIKQWISGIRLSAILNHWLSMII